MTRLPAEAGEIIDRTHPIAFDFAGRAVQGFQGDTVASALCAAGQTIFSRSFKYHRPRGLLCVSGKCPNCLMNVDGVPNVRTCTEPLREAMKVLPQNCWPSLERDRLSVIQKFDMALPVGFYYKMFARPKWAWKAVEPMIRRMAGLGRILPDAPDTHFEHLHLHCDVAVVGGGPAGISAAISAAEIGADVFLIEEEPELGGHLRYHQRLSTESTENGFELAARMAAQVSAEPRIRVFRRATAFGAYEGGLLAVKQGNSLTHVRTAKLVVATGAFEYPSSFDGNDLPGIMLASGVRRLVLLYGVKPGSRAVICGRDDESLALALDLLDRGIKVEAVADERTGHQGGSWADALRHAGVPVLQGYRPVAATGSGRIQEVLLEAPGTTARSQSQACDLLVLGTEYAGSLELLRQSGVRCQFDEELGQLAPVHGSAPDVFFAGRLTGVRLFELEILGGQLAGMEAASGVENERLRHRLRADEAEYRSRARRERPATLPDSASQFVCFCEDVKQKDLALAIREGFDDLETLKRYSTVTMGPCQGRMCHSAAIRFCGERTGKTARDTGSTTARPPVQPVSLGLLAGAGHHPVKLTPMHHKHLAAAATQMNMGEWKRPHTYTSQEEEWRAVRERAGMIDVSTLGKLELKGPDAGNLLDLVYTNVFSTLKPGRVRYGIICNDEGIILDDGTVSRLAANHYFVTTTTGNVEFVERWLEWWLAGSGKRVYITNVTGQYASVNVAGPRARDTLRKLTGTDLSPESFPYMACRQASIAGVPAILLRIGFVGETGWEIHYPASFGEYLWDTILEAGAEFDIRPFGVETQRILRLEKRHLIVGQDTDALSNPFEADMAWCVKSEKTDFIGKGTLEYLRQKPESQKLVGFVLDGARAVAEGSVVVHQARPVGRVTSSRVSPYLAQTIGMAWVPSDSACAGQRIEIRADGTNISARVVDQPFYDPDGKRLRE